MKTGDIDQDCSIEKIGKSGEYPSSFITRKILDDVPLNTLIDTLIVSVSFSLFQTQQHRREEELLTRQKMSKLQAIHAC